MRATCSYVTCRLRPVRNRPRCQGGSLHDVNCVLNSIGQIDCGFESRVDVSESVGERGLKACPAGAPAPHYGLAPTTCLSHLSRGKGVRRQWLIKHAIDHGACIRGKSTSVNEFCRRWMAKRGALLLRLNAAAACAILPVQPAMPSAGHASSHRISPQGLRFASVAACCAAQ